MDRWQDKRVWLGGGALVAVLIAVASWFAVIHPQLSSAASLRTQAAEADAQNSLALVKVATLRNQAKDLGSLTAALTSALEALPPTSGLPAFTRQLSAQAKTSHVTVSGISIGSVNVTGSAGATTTAPSNAAPTSAAGGLYAIPVTITSSGRLAGELAFLTAIQTVGPRRALVTSTQFAPGSGAKEASIDGSATVTVQLSVFSAPLNPAQAAQLQKLLHGDVSN